MSWSASSRCTMPPPSPESSLSRWPARPVCWFRRRATWNGCAPSAARHGLLLIFDEVITGFGRLGAATAAEFFGVRPDIITLAKGINNASVPLGAVAVNRPIYDTVVNTADPDSIELFHGYTYSAHPLAAAATVAALDIYQRDGLFERARSLSGHSSRPRTHCAARRTCATSAISASWPASSSSRARDDPAAAAMKSSCAAWSAACWCATPPTPGVLAAADRRTGADRADIRHGGRGTQGRC